MDIITHFCFVWLYSFAPFSLPFKCFTRFYYSRQEDFIFNKKKTTADNSHFKHTEYTQNEKRKRQTSGANIVDISLMLV